MLGLLADEDFNFSIVRGIRRRNPSVDILLVPDVMPRGTTDPDVLSWAADHCRVILTHDRNTMVGWADERARRGLLVPSLVVVPQNLALQSVIEDVCLVASASLPGEEYNQRFFLPLR